MERPKYKIKAKVWLYSGKAAWHFLTLPLEISEQIRELFGEYSRGWGSLPIEIKIGNTNWQTSVFPDKKSGCYFLPLKSAIRKKENIKNGDEVEFTLEVKV